MILERVCILCFKCWKILKKYYMLFHSILLIKVPDIKHVVTINNLWMNERKFYSAQVQLLVAPETIIWEASVNRMESSFNQTSQKSGERVDLCFQANSKDLAQPWQYFKEKIGVESHESLSKEIGFCSLLCFVQMGWLSHRYYPAPVICQQDC